MSLPSHLQTHHSTILFKNGSLTKVIEPDHEFAPGERESLMGAVQHYRQLLRDLGIPVADNYELRLDGGQLVEKTDNCGDDGFVMLQAGHHDLVIPAIVRAILPILAQKRMKVTIDPHPANWCFRDGQMNYVDFHPARYLRGSEYIVGFPQPTAERELQYSLSRYYNRTGIIRSLRFSAVRSGGRKAENMIYDEMQKYPSQISKPILDELAALPERQFRDGGNIVDVLEPLDVWRVDDVREIALVIADRMEKDAATVFLGEVLELTRGDFNRPLEQRSDLMKQAKFLIIKQARASLAA